jgi:predicted secreted hydrolase
MSPDLAAMYDTPVVLFIYNRPETTRRVMEILRKVQPRQLFVVSDGPPGRYSEIQGPIEESRRIATRVDWSCEVKTRFASRQLGGRHCITKGIDWVFEQVETAIFLEDDVAPDLDFFSFCREMLAHYAHTPEIMAVQGANLLFDRSRPPHSYYFSQYLCPWGWATWKRAWAQHDPLMVDWPELRKSGWLKRVLGHPSDVAHWTTRLDDVFFQRLDVFDLPWMLTILRHGLCITPANNLVSNLGWGAGSSNTHDINSPFAALPTSALARPLVHPESVAQYHSGDAAFALIWRMYRQSPQLCAAHLGRERSPPPERPYAITFPQDEGPHEVPLEWWYHTGHLQTKEDEVYGFEVTLFKLLIGHETWHVGHFSLTDTAKGEHFQSASRSNASPSNTDCGYQIHFGDWRLDIQPHTTRLAVRAKHITLNIELGSQKPPVVHGEGTMYIGSEHPMYYYSKTRMQASGILEKEGCRFEVQGQAWMDHQWGQMGQLGSDYRGWSWFSLRFNDHTECMLFQTHEMDGRVSFLGSFIDAQGEAHLVSEAECFIQGTGNWTSPHTGLEYPSGWRVVITPLGLTVDVTPVLADQEIHRDVEATPPYWEGLCTVRGSRRGREIGGNAFVELVRTRAR